MSDPAAPWWADVQHLRPRDDAASPAEPARFTHERAQSARDAEPARRERHEAGVATLEHEVPGAWGDAPAWPDEEAAAGSQDWTAEPDPPAWQAKGAAAWQADDAAWLDTLGMPADPSPSRVWDPALEEAFARTPSWAEQDDERLLPKGANRIENGRRTIEIRGQVDRIAGIPAPAETAVATRSGRRRPARRPAERLAGRPDRVAMWAFLLGILLILIAALSDPSQAAAAATVL